jgi:small subunit ribosomal protein S7
MPRAGRITKPLPEPDPVYGNRTVTRFVNRVMFDGKKSIAAGLVYKALDAIKAKGEDPMKVFETAINNVGPKVEVRPRRVGGASYQVPIEVRGDRRVALAIRWIVNFAKKRSNREYKTYDQKLTQELLDAAAGIGEAIKKRDTVHRMADANKAFAHFRW